MKPIEITVSLDENKRVIKTFGDGASEITFSTDATQLAKVLSALAYFKGQAIKMKLYRENIEENSTKKNNPKKVHR